MTQAEMKAEIEEIRKVFEYDLIPSVESLRSLIGGSVPQRLRRTYERIQKLHATVLHVQPEHE